MVSSADSGGTRRVPGYFRAGAGFALQGLNQLLWPKVCINDGRRIFQSDGELCNDCWAELIRCTGSDYCPRCGREASRYGLVDGCCPDCVGRQMHFDRIARSGIYTDVLRKMILAFKNGATELDKILAFLARCTLEASGFYEQVELLVPVPLHWRRRLVRGFNQSEILAKRLCHSEERISKDLVRTRYTKFQPTMANAAQRAANVAGAFAVRRGHRFRHRSVCLVDDVKTSGATLNECARILKQAGAAEVFALVLAVAGQKEG